MIRRTLAIASLTAAALVARGQEAYLVKDINTTTPAAVSSSNPANFVRFGSKVYFAATSSSGRELWATDGTASGTSQVADIEPGAGSSSPAGFVVLNGSLLFNATDKAHGEELWITDGTKDGTRLLADINSNPGQSSNPGSRIVFHGAMLFAASDAAHGNELWVTDGTGAGTKLLKDLNPGSLDSAPSSFVLLGDVVYFTTYAGLWKTDGTADGTVLVAPVRSPYRLVVSGNRLFFSAFVSDTPYRYDAWVSDGTEAGTRKLADFPRGVLGLTPFRNGVLLYAPDEQTGQYSLWFSDGTAGAAREFVRPTSLTLSAIAVVGDQAYVPTQTDLWKTNGTEEGTVAVRSFDGKPLPAPSQLTPANGLLYFVAGASDNRTLWVTDGTDAGRHRAKTSSALFVSAQDSLANVDGTLYFSGGDSRNGYELWKSDGTDSGTAMIANIAADGTPSSDPMTFTAADDWVYFDAVAGDDSSAPGTPPRSSLWRSDGTPEGTIHLSENYGNVIGTTGHAAYVHMNSTLWVSDGTAQGTTPATSLTQRFGGYATLLFTSGEKLFFGVAPRIGYDAELWVTTASSTQPVRLGPKTAYRATDVAGRLFFFVDRDLWLTDGTPAGTRQVTTLPAAPSAAGAMGGSLYFSVSVNNVATLYRSDGTADGTIALKPLPQSAAVLVPAGRKLFFTCAGQLWVTDGTPAGTQSLGVTTSALAAAGDRVVFTGTDAASGTELWVSDGTVAGTRLLRDINPGVDGSLAGNLTAAGGLVYFTAYDPLHGNELWVTDGTDAGTKLASDIVPGPAGSNPANLTVTTERLFFSATTPATGRELWALPLPAQLRVADIHLTEGASPARFTVSLPHALDHTVTVDYATADGTATAGSDYDAVAGTLTFAPGETSKVVDVPVRDDHDMENDETFFLTLRNASGAGIGNAIAAAVIVDEDVAIDVAATLDFGNTGNFLVRVLAKNNGTRTATGLHTSMTTVTPGPQNFICYSCATQVAPGASTEVTGYAWGSAQQYLTATVVANERDPNPANNSVGWTVNGSIGMDALYVAPGTDANIWFLPPEYAQATYTITSSNPAVVSVPASVQGTFRIPATFVVHGVAAGTATIRVFTGTSFSLALDIDVRAAGTTRRWPGAVKVITGTPRTITDPMYVGVTPDGTAPFTGENATGRITIKAGGREVGHLVLDGSGRGQSIQVYLAALGTQTVTIDYEGDRNFLPSSTAAVVSVTSGTPTILAGAVRSGTGATFRVRVTGSPGATPTGTVTVSEAGGGVGSLQATLAESSPGTGEAVFTVANLSAGTHTFTVTYSGDSRYLSGSQSMRLTEPRGHAARP